MKHAVTLPGLEAMLAQLPDGRKLALASKQIEELFGLNGVRSERLARFASAHACIVVHEDSCVVFEKRRPDPSPTGRGPRPC